MAIPAGFKLVKKSSEIPAGFKLVTPAEPEEILEPAQVGGGRSAAAARKPAQEEGPGVFANVVEPALAIGSSLVAEPIAGVSGGVQALGTVAQTLDPEQAGRRGGEVLEQVREKLTFEPSPEGQEALQDIIAPLQPIGEALQSARQGIGDSVFNVTKSPFLAAAAQALPDAALELLGFGLGRKAARVSTGLKEAPGKIPSPGKASQRQVSKALVESAPQIDQLKDVSRGIYTEIDNLGVTLKPKAFNDFVKKVVGKANKRRPNVNRTPKAFGAVEEFVTELEDITPKTLADIDDLRFVAADAAGAIDNADSSIGMIMLDEIDDFLDSVPQEAFQGVNAGDAAQVGESYKAARNLWGRARRAEVIEDAFVRAGRQASGFENGLRVQLRQIVQNKKRARFFTKEEISAMDDVIQGSGQQNILKLVGRLGFSEGQATNVLGGLGGAFVGGPGVPILGQISRKLAQRATKQGVDFADALIRSGTNGRRITEAYLKVTPKAQRSVKELSDLLLNPDIDLEGLLNSADKFTKDAIDVTRGRRAFQGFEATGAAAPQLIPEEQQ